MYGFINYFGILHERNQLYKQARTDPHYKSYVDKIVHDITLVCYDSNSEDWGTSYKIPHDFDAIILKDLVQKQVKKRRICLGFPVDISVRWDSHKKGERLLVVRIPPHRSNLY